jgi:glycerate kinase
MHIVIAPNSFKESLTAPRAADAIARGLKRVFPRANYRKVPLADGGEGTVDAMVAATNGRKHAREVTGPLGRPVRAHYGVLGDGITAVVEMAAASGLPLVPPAERNPMRTTSFGTGELIRAAVERGVRRLIVGIGGSATNDGGAGLAQALGVRFLDARGREITAPLSGGELGRITRIDFGGALFNNVEVEVLVACDVTNPLLGPRGASSVYGPQKGASAADVQRLEANLGHFGALLERSCGRRFIGRPGAGAAGGMGAGLMAFCNGRLQRGVDIVIAATALDRTIRTADLVVTGEGRVDAQTMMGKTPAGVARLARRWGVPVVVVAGSLGPNARRGFRHGLAAMEAAVSEPLALEEALSRAPALVADAAERAARWLAVGRSVPSKRR